MMGKIKTNRNVVLCIIPFIVNCLINIYVTIKVISIITNPYIRAVLSWGNTLGVKVSPKDIIGAIRGLAEWGLIPKSFTITVIVVGCVQLAIAIYGIVLYWGICRDINIICAKAEGNNSKESFNYIIVMLLSLVTLGIYYLVWVYQQGERMRNADQNYYHKGVRAKGGSYLVLSLLGNLTCGITSSILTYSFLQNLNLLSEAYAGMGNAGVGGSGRSEAAQHTPIHGSMNDDVMTVPVGISYGMAGHMEGCSGMYAGADIEILANEEIIIGRDESCANLILKNEKVSRKHCSIRYIPSNGTYVVTDYSKNGVYYKNGQRLPSGTPTVLKPGTIIIITQGNEFLLK